MKKAMQWLGHNSYDLEKFCPKLKVLNKAVLFLTSDNFKCYSLYLDNHEVLPYDFIVKSDTDKYEIKNEEDFYAEYEEE